MVEKRYWLAAAALIGLLAGVQVTSMLGETQTWDEGIHLVAGYSYLVTGEYSMNPEHPALGKMLCALPLLPLHPNFKESWKQGGQQIAGLEFMYANRVEPELMLGLGRGVTVLLTLLFASWIAFWTRRHFGAAAGLIALALFCFDPNIIAHGRYITTDLVASLFVFLACTLWIDYLSEPTRTRLILSGLALGAALTSKYSALFLVPLFIAAGLYKRRWKQTAAVLLIAWAAVIAVYLPEVWRLPWNWRLREQLTRTGALSNALYFLARKLSLRPWTYLVGLDRLSEHNAVGHPSYLLGQIAEHGWWYYFPVALAVKTPMATLAAIGATAVLIWKARSAGFRLAALAVVPVVFFGFCLTSHIDIGYRHLLPMLAFLFVLAGIALSRYPKTGAVLVFVLAVESLSIYPYYLTFFNQAAGGPKAGPKYLLDSNIDWGQDIRRLGTYLKAHNISNLCFYYFGNVDWGRYGVQTIDFPEGHPEQCDAYGAVSVTPLFGLYAPPGYFAFLRDREPMARVGNSIYVYDLRKRK